jgi:hypothetical protein
MTVVVIMSRNITEQGWLSRYNDGLLARPVVTLQRPDRLCGSPSLLIQWVMAAVSPGLKRPGREANHSIYCRDHEWRSYTSTPSYVSWHKPSIIPGPYYLGVLVRDPRRHLGGGDVKKSFINPNETQEPLEAWTSCDPGTHEHSSQKCGGIMPETSPIISLTGQNHSYIW